MEIKLKYNPEKLNVEDIKRKIKELNEEDIKRRTPRTWNIDGMEVIESLLFEVTAGTNGPKGGDYGHGGRACFKIKSEGGALKASFVHRTCDEKGRLKLERYGTEYADEVEIVVGGDWEIQEFINSLRWAADTLEKQWEENMKKEER